VRNAHTIGRPGGNLNEHIQKRGEDIEHCKRAMESNVLPFPAELKQHLGDGQFTFAPQIDMQDHQPDIAHRDGGRRWRAHFALRARRHPAAAKKF
jgi:hypothetical protein